MQPIASRFVSGLSYLLIVLACSGCAAVALGASTLPAASTDEVLSARLRPDSVAKIALNALEAWNAADFAGWSRDWSATLKAGVRPGDFEVFRDRYFDRYGSCFAIVGSNSGPSPRTGYVRWAFDVECRSGRLRFTFAFPEGSTQVASIYVEPLK